MMDLASLHIETRLVYGVNSIESLGDEAGALGATRVLVVTDRGVADAGHAERACASIRSAGLDPILFDRVHENPTTKDVDVCLEAAREAKIDLFVGLGGGSSIDTARGCNFLLTNGGQMKDYWGMGKATKPMLPMIAVPTTTGTGSEMQSFALIADAESHQKMACGDKKAIAKVAILDPSLSVTQPRPVIAHTGLDCIAHALETAVTRKRTPFSRLFSREAWRLASANFGVILETPGDIAAQGRMLRASACAGIAIEHSMLGAAHSMANPLTAHFDVVHGEAVGMLLPHVVRHNAQLPAARSEYAELARLSGCAASEAVEDEAVASLIATLVSHLERSDTPRSLNRARRLRRRR